MAPQSPGSGPPWDQQPWDQTQAYPPQVDYPQANYAQSAYPPAGYPPGGYGPPGYPAYQPRKTNGMAIAALIGALTLSPLGIIFGHISLAQIKRTGEDGRGLALAGLIIGYIATALFVIGMVLMFLLIGIFASAVENSDYDSYSSYDYSLPTETPVGVPDSSARAIFQASEGDCIHRAGGTTNNDGTQDVTVDSASCGTSYATDRVILRTDDTSDCSGDWVRTTSYSPQVVLCLVDD